MAVKLQEDVMSRIAAICSSRHLEVGYIVDIASGMDELDLFGSDLMLQSDVPQYAGFWIVVFWIQYLCSVRRVSMLMSEEYCNTTNHYRQSQLCPRSECPLHQPAAARSDGRIF